MNTVAFPKKAERLTEQDVHNAIAEMIAAGDKPSALNLLKMLGRGSLTTISKFMTSYFSALDAGTGEVNPPALMEVPREIGLSSELLVKKLWADARALANQEIESQRAALVQAEAEAALKVTEAMEFSELQARRIEELENLVDELRTMLNDEKHEMGKLQETIKAMTLDGSHELRKRELAEHDVELLKKHINDYKKTIDTLTIKSEADIRSLKEKDRTIKELEKLNNALELNVGKQQLALDQQANNLDALKKDLAEQRAESKKAGEYAAKLAGMLEVYQLQEKTAKEQIKKKPTKMKENNE